MTLDEQALRKEGFSEGPRVKLGDGQVWTFPAPYLSVQPRVDPDGSFGLRQLFTYGKDYADRLDDLIECTDAGQALFIELELATGLLLRNYALDNRQLRRLLSFDLDGRGDPEMWVAIQEVLVGLNLPKPTAVGSDSAPGPTASTPIPSP